MPIRYERARLGNLPRGKVPFALRSYADRGFAGHRRAATLPLHSRVQSPSEAASLPLRRLDRVPTPRDRTPAGLPPTALGFSHSPVPPPREEGDEEKGEEGGGEKKEGAPPPHRIERTGGRPRSGAGAAKTGAAVLRGRVVRVQEARAEVAPPP
jgi:hypothetical protein